MPMQSRTDQVHSYQFFLHRVISGLVARESDPAELPFRRLGWSAFGSIMVMIIVAAGFGVYGLYVGGGATSWQDGRSIIWDKTSRTPYILLENRLYPMANMVSAQLALGTTAVTQVTARSLEGVPRGPTLGIPDAPEALPDSRDLLTGEWTFCTRRQDDGLGAEHTVSVLGVGRGPDGGEPVGRYAVLVRDADTDVLHLVWNGHRFSLAAVEGGALRSLGLDPGRALPVASDWLRTLPAGDRLVPPEVRNRGEPTALVGEELDLLAGQVAVANGTFYLVQPEGLEQITEVQKEMVFADPATRVAYRGDEPYLREDVPPAALAEARGLPDLTATSPPERPPVPVPLDPRDAEDAAVCAVFAPGEYFPEVRAGARLPATEGDLTSGQSEQGTKLADYVVVAGGKAALVQTISSPTAPPGAWSVVTDQRLRYGLATGEVANMLGLEPGKRVVLPAGLVARLPAGPDLDPAVAFRPVTNAVPGSGPDG